jgi:hypothetical protein
VIQIIQVVEIKRIKAPLAGTKLYSAASCHGDFSKHELGRNDLLENENITGSGKLPAESAIKTGCFYSAE